MKQNTIRKEMKSKNRSNKNMHTSKNKTKRYTGSGQGSSKSKKAEIEMTIVEKVSEIKKMAKSVKKILSDFYIPEDESVKEILKSIKSLDLDKGTIVEQGELISFLYTSMEKILHNKPSTVDKPPTPPRPTPTVAKKQSPPRPTPTVAKKPSSVHDEVGHIEKMREKFNTIIYKISRKESVSKEGFDKTLEYMTPLEKIKAIVEIAPSIARLAGLKIYTQTTFSGMKIGEIKNLLKDLGISEPMKAIDKSEYTNLFYKAGKNDFLDEMLKDIVFTTQRKNDKIQEMRKKLDDILDGKIQKFKEADVYEILKYMSNIDKINVIKRMKPTLVDMLKTDVTEMSKLDEVLSLSDTLGIKVGKKTDLRGLERKDLEILVNKELDNIGSNAKIDKMFVDVLNKLVEERDIAYEKENKEAEEKYQKEMEEYNKKKKEAEEKYQKEMKEYNKQQEAIRRAEEKKKRQEQVQDINGRIWNKSIHTDGKPYYWDAVTGESVWFLPGQVPPPPPVYPQTQGYTYVYDPYTAAAMNRQAEAERELRSIPRHLRHGDNYNPKTFDDLPNNTWR